MSNQNQDSNPYLKCEWCGEEYFFHEGYDASYCSESCWAGASPRGGRGESPTKGEKK